MGYRVESSFFFLVLCLLFVWIYAVEGGRWSLSKEEDLEMERQLKILNKPYVKTFKNEHGIIYDCVDIYKQPAFDHPLLKNHTIQMRPTSFPEGMINGLSEKGKLLNISMNERCPLGTVLIRRTQKEDLIRAKKYSPHVRPQGIEVEGTHYAMAIVKTSGGLKYYGAQARMDVFELPDVTMDKGSSAQIILTKGQDGPQQYLNTIQFGWHIFYHVTGDNHTHLFTYWTSDGYNNTGCYNMFCPGFVQLSDGFEPGLILPEGRGALYPSVFKDSKTGNWILVLVDKNHEVLGYWPKELFNNMADVSQIQMGGLVYSPFDAPSPPMGSGIIPRNPEACEFQQVGLMNGNGEFVAPSLDVDVYTDIIDDGFYAITQPENLGGEVGCTFQFGGPGGWMK